ncbi:MAG: DUF1049 domain-containing protein [Deltaproteobacteria bacterium]|nr:DUF1049 domain-containing protein [Deltaproteobacteria bacterium]
MGKIKALLLVLMGALLTVFFLENWVAAPPLKIFAKEVVELQTSLIIIICLALGFIGGWLSGFNQTRQRRSPRGLEPRTR